MKKRKTGLAKKPRGQTPPTMRYMIIDDAGDISRELFESKKLDFIATRCQDCPSYEGVYLYFLSRETSEFISSFLKWKTPSQCATYFCIKLKGELNNIIQIIATKADLKKVR